MVYLRAVVVCLATVVAGVHAVQQICTSTYRFGAFNPYPLGPTKMGNPQAVGILSEIIWRYDVVVVQGIKDANEIVQTVLLDHVNLNTLGLTYAMNCSERLGTSSSKIQYCFYYRTGSLVLDDTYQYPDGNSWFMRPPYCGLFSLKDYPQSGFLIPFCTIQTSTTNACDEIEHLLDVHGSVSSNWPTASFPIIAGSLNADTGYCSISNLQNIPFYNSATYDWIIKDDIDTTVSSTNRAYDRIVASGQSQSNWIVEGSGATYNFSAAFGLDLVDAKAVSNRYPVEFDVSHTGPVY